MGIVTESILAQIFEQIPPLTAAGKPTYPTPKFYWGNDKDLNAFMKCAPVKYPLIWLIEGLEVEDLEKGGTVTRDCKFVLAINSLNQSELNPTTWANDFTDYLNPLRAQVIKGLQKSRATWIKGSASTIRRANHSEDGEKTPTTDVWNAIRLDVTVVFEPNKCVNTSIYG